MTQHTATPWHTTQIHTRWVDTVRDKDDYDIAALCPRYGDIEMRANGAFIVQACNNYDGLLAALKAAQGRWAGLECDCGHASCEDNRVRGLVLAAIAKAEEVQS